MDLTLVENDRIRERMVKVLIEGELEGDFIGKGEKRGKNHTH
jgi:hypothetical protein